MKRELFADEAALEDHTVAARTEATLGEEGVERLAGLGLVGADEHALAGGEAVGLEHHRVGRAGELLGRLGGAAQQDVGGGRHARPRASAPWRRPSSPRAPRRRRSARRRGCPPPRGRRRPRRRGSPRARPRPGRPAARRRRRRSPRRPRRRPRAGTRRRRRSRRCPARRAARASGPSAPAPARSRARAPRRR